MAGLGHGLSAILSSTPPVLSAILGSTPPLKNPPLSEGPPSEGGAPEPPEPPDEYTCPITYELMADPVFATDGHTYERDAIEQWLVRKTTSPKTGLPLEVMSVFPNYVMGRQFMGWR